MEASLFDALDKIIEKYADKRGSLIPVLHESQNHIGYLPLEVQEYIADKLSLPLSQVYGVVTFYSYFSTTPKGKHTVGVCMGTACYVRGAEAILDVLAEELGGVELGETSEDGLFTLTQTRCVAACGLAPVLMVDDRVYGNLAPDDIPEIIDRYRSAAVMEVDTGD